NGAVEADRTGRQTGRRGHTCRGGRTGTGRGRQGGSTGGGPVCPRRGGCFGQSGQGNAARRIGQRQCDVQRRPFRHLVFGPAWPPRTGAETAGLQTVAAGFAVVPDGTASRTGEAGFLTPVPVT